MPYIRQEERIGLDEYIPLLADRITHPGQMSYVITRLILWRLKHTKLSYVGAATWIGMLILTALELWRRCIVPYEDGKRKENGDVY